MKLYALYDVKADAYSNFVAEKSDAVATRQFAEAVTQPNSVLGKYADDFELVRIVDLPESIVELRQLDSELAFDHIVVVTARQVMDLEVKASPDSAQLSLIKEA